jgi:L-threonylcarbamoyladenylate synthase
MSDSYRQLMALRALRAGGVIAYPTEAVWGLGCDPGNEAALQKLLALKQRDADKGLILVVAELEQLGSLLHPLSPAQRRQLLVDAPGPVTWLVPHSGLVHPLVRGHFATVAVRISRHPVVSVLCRGFGGPLVSTSANTRGRQPARDAAAVRRYFCGSIDYLLAGSLGDAQRPSEIRDLVSGRVIRPG